MLTWLDSRRKPSMFEIEDLGEESGRDQASDEFYPDEKSDSYRDLRRRGRARAQGTIYQLRGRNARQFSIAWAQGYFSEYDWMRREVQEDSES